MIGQTLGHYRIEAKLGEGGMGVVYRAQDTRLGRDVAIKVLPEAFVRDPERLARFEREARLLASLNHPNIAAIHGLEEHDGLRYLVLEYVPGQTLAECLKRGPLPVAESLETCKQIAEGLEAAHQKGIIHRDLKPANVKVTPEGKVKVLDFGLAKAFEDGTASADLSKSPTLSLAATARGVILGTAAYMSPEQARGAGVDRRTDIWALGCVLYEMLTGRRAFEGPTVSDTLASVLKTEPEWSAFPADTPPKVRELVRRCLQKDPNRRLHDIADARIEMEEARWGPPAAPAVTVAAPRAAPWRRAVPWTAAGLLALLAAVALGLLWRATRAPQPVTRLVVALPPAEPLALGNQPAVAFSPDGRRLVYVGGRGGRRQLYLRPMDRLEATSIPGTDGAEGPFFSPDGESLGFFSGGKLKKITLSGGAAQTLCDAPAGRGASWGPDDTIIFTPNFISGIGLSRVSAAGGAPQALTTPDPKKGERGHRWPQILPGGKAVLFTVWTLGGLDEGRIAVQSLLTGERWMLVEGGSDAHYAPTGHLIYARTTGLLAVPFDLARLRVTGSPFPVVEGVITKAITTGADFSFSRSGSLVYVPGGVQGTELTLVWVDRKGTARPLTGTRHAYRIPRLSPDGRRLAVAISERGKSDIWVYDLARDTSTRLTFEGNNRNPLWTRDGLRVTFDSQKSATWNLFSKPADGSGQEERLTTATNPQAPHSWSRDGKALAFTETAPNTAGDIWMLPMEGESPGRPRLFLQTPFYESQAAFSPDGRWLAYTSNESARLQVYVQPFPGPGGKWQISTEGGAEPVWARNGRELFYRNGDKMMAVDISTQPQFTVGKPRLLFEAKYEFFAGATNYDVAPDDQRFVMVKGTEEASAPMQVNVVLNWFDELKRRVPSGNK